MKNNDMNTWALTPQMCSKMPLTEVTNSKLQKFKDNLQGIQFKISNTDSMLSMIDTMIVAEAKKTGHIVSPKRIMERNTPNENDPVVIEGKNRLMKSTCERRIEAMKKTEDT